MNQTSGTKVVSVSDLEPNSPSTTPPDATPQVSTQDTPTKHPQPEMRNVELDSVAPKRGPLNPAYAILAAAILSAGTAITATYLNIRSSERLQREQDRTDAAKRESDYLKAQLTALQTKLNETSKAIDALAENTDSPSSASPGSPVSTAATVAPTPVVAPLPSIIVVLPSTPPTVLTVTPTAKAEPKVDPKPVARAESPATPPPTQATTSTTTTLPPTTVQPTTATVPAAVSGPVPAGAALPTTASTTKLP